MLQTVLALPASHPAIVSQALPLDVPALRRRARFIVNNHLRIDEINSIDDLVRMFGLGHELALFEEGLARNLKSTANGHFTPRGSRT
jgi:hypothetical protein